MQINTSGIMKKLEDNAHILTWLLASYYRFNGDISRVVHNYTHIDFMQNMKFALRDPKHFLWDSDHLYTQIFKTGVYAYLGAEIGLVPAKYKKTIEKVLLGSGVAAMTLPEGAYALSNIGHGAPIQHDRPSSGGYRGVNPFLR